MRLTRIVKSVLLGLVAYAFISVGEVDAKTKKKVPCRKDLSHCPDQGCGSDFDPNLNRLKNIRPNDPRAAGAAEKRTLGAMKNLDNPNEFEKGDDRDALTALGEGKKISVVAFLIGIKPEGGESCNCGLTKTEWTDNHLVLVTRTTLNRFPLAPDEDEDDIFHSRELESITAEFTPRVRETHPNFTREKVKPLIDDAAQKALLVRLTGMLMFDSEHFIRNPLKRANNWEIHPILKFEYCPNRNCTAQSDAGWKSLDDIQ